MRAQNLLDLHRQARRLAKAGVTIVEIRRQTGLSLHHVLVATRPGFAARKAHALKVRRWAARGLPAPKRGQRLPHGMDCRWRGRLPIPASANPLVREMVAEMNMQQRTMLEVARAAGLRRETMSQWRYTRLPKIDLFQAALNVLGLELVIVPVVGAEHDPAEHLLDLALQLASAGANLAAARYSPAERDARANVDRLLAEIVRVAGAHA